MQGIVTQSTGSWYEVRLGDGQMLSCRLAGKLRLAGLKNTNPAVVGDVVTIDLETDGATAVIREIHQRRNYIIRQSPTRRTHKHIIAANIDQVFLVATLAKPRTKLGFIDRFLMTATAYDIPANIVFNKADIYSKKQQQKLEQLIRDYEKIGYGGIAASAETGEGIERVKELLKDKTTLISGQSGVGKSSVINSIQPGLELKVNEISEHVGKGQHTTTFATMFELSFGGFIIDTPGIKEFGILDMLPEEVAHHFPEMSARVNDCRFNNCLHINEPGCAVIEAFENDEISETRFRNYINIVEDLQQRNRWEV